MSNNEEKEYIEKVNKVVIKFRDLINNPPSSMSVKDPNSLKKSNEYLNQANEKLSHLRTGGALIGYLNYLYKFIFNKLKLNKWEL